MTTALIAILVGVVSAFSKSIFDRIFKEYNPDTKKLISNIKRFFRFIVRYVLPISFLILLFIFAEFNKSFVLSTSIIITSLFVNMIVDGLEIISEKTFSIFELLLNIQNTQLDALKKVYEVAVKNSHPDKKTESNENKNNP